MWKNVPRDCLELQGPGGQFTVHTGVHLGWDLNLSRSQAETCFGVSGAGGGNFIPGLVLQLLFLVCVGFFFVWCLFCFLFFPALLYLFPSVLLGLCRL